MKAFALLFVVVLAGCETSAPTPTAAPAPPVAAQVSTPTPESIARADALLADMRRREADFKEFERSMPQPKAVRLEDFIPREQPNSTPNVVAASATDQPSVAQTVSAPAGSAKDETWWKDQMRVLVVQLEADQRLLAAAERQMDSTTLRLTYDQATAEYNKLIAAVASDRAAITRLEEDARRANVPPGWLRQ